MENSNISVSELSVTLPRICEDCEAFITDDLLPSIVLYYFSPTGFFEERYRDVDIQCTECQLADLCGVRDALSAVYDAPPEMFTVEMFKKLISDLYTFGAFNYPETWHSLPSIVWKWRHRVHLETLFNQIELCLGKDWAIKFFRYAADVAFLAADSILISLQHSPPGGGNVEALRQAIADIRKSMIDSIQGPEGLQSIFAYIEGLFEANGYGRDLEGPVTEVSPPNGDNGTSLKDGQSLASQKTVDGR
ncbi:uncharacterized protein F4817DRAFT_364158 [Daldinia loculata]|uniref:uncharacterized protein n=1 Tax=Daldinia loculata TaxID=103429 RepID=UPI0020C58B2E|nr:uncharacterized protein F4817DRAFT_364158 [Daldinia loculata]KAI1648744.1 hypothetical protein F4817DRAFT_364158 [Daldinia loculata]